MHETQAVETDLRGSFTSKQLMVTFLSVTRADSRFLCSGIYLKMA